jgi:ferredoxin-NADP reductase
MIYEIFLFVNGSKASMMNEYTATLSKKIQLTPDMVELHFTKPDGFTYTAGQFVQVKIPYGQDITLRSYSLASIPQDKHLAFCVKLIPNGVGSTFFKQIRHGEDITLRGPLGHFVCAEEAKAHFFIATGAGIAPIMGMIRDEIENKKIKKGIHLLFGLRFAEDIFWLDRLDKFARENDRFSYQLTLSRPDESWNGLKGRVTEHLAEHPIDHDFYLCGSMDMVKDVRGMLLKNGVSVKKVRMEIF